MVVDLLADDARCRGMEARMGNRVDESPAGLEKVGQRGHQRRYFDHVHQAHVADRRIERSLAERAQRGFVSGIEHMIGDGVSGFGRSLPGPGDEPLAEIERHNLGTGPGHAAGEWSVSAGDIQDAFPGPETQEPFSWWVENLELKPVALTDPVCPPVGIGVPDVVRLLNSDVMLFRSRHGHLSFHRSQASAVQRGPAMICRKRWSGTGIGE